MILTSIINDDLILGEHNKNSSKMKKIPLHINLIVQSINVLSLYSFYIFKYNVLSTCANVLVLFGINILYQVSFEFIN